MTVYQIKSTRIDQPTIDINETEIDATLSVKLFGRKRLSYGKDLNQNLLRLLESFACPRGDGEIGNFPDFTRLSDPTMFDHPKVGQLWYDSTPLSERLNVWNGEAWVIQQKAGDVAANWGIIADGGQIPLPVASSGNTFAYHECSWIVSPYGYPNTIDYMRCDTDESANVTMKYSLEGSASELSGYALYLIIGIPDNDNLGTLIVEV